MNSTAKKCLKLSVHQDLKNWAIVTRFIIAVACSNSSTEVVGQLSSNRTPTRIKTNKL